MKNRFFYFGDYQGTRSRVGGSKLVTVPTLWARTGDLSEYGGLNIFDPTHHWSCTLSADVTPDLVWAVNSSQATLFRPTAFPSRRGISCNWFLLPNAPGIDGGTRNNFVAGGSEVFNNDTFDVRLDGKISDRINLFGRYSFADFKRLGPQAFGAGGGEELVSLGGTSKVRNQSLAIGFDYTLERHDSA